MLENWFNLLPVNVTVDLYKDFLPKLSDFLHIEGVLNERNIKKRKNMTLLTHTFIRK
jgi:hypothetical protein